MIKKDHKKVELTEDQRIQAATEEYRKLLAQIEQKYKVNIRLALAESREFPGTYRAAVSIQVV